MNYLTIILGCLLAAWFLMVVRDRIVSTKKLKEIFVKGDTRATIKKYEDRLLELDSQINNINRTLEDNNKLTDSRRKRKDQKRLENLLVKTNKEREEISLAKEQFEALATDFKNNKNSLPTRKMQKHLTDYLNNKKHF